MTKKSKYKHCEQQDARDQREPARSRSEKLRKAWKKASESERSAFLAEIGLRKCADPIPMLSGERQFIANGRYLLPITVRRIKIVMIRRRLSPEALVEELGLAGEGRNLARALAKGGSLRLRVIASIEEWLTIQEQESPK